VDSDGRTPLFRAIYYLDLDLAEMLLKTGGCDPNITDNEGRTPLKLAVSRYQAAHSSEDSTTVSQMQPNATEPESSELLWQLSY